MHNDHGQFDTRSPLKSVDSSVRVEPKWPMLAAAGVGGAVVGWFIPLSLIESVTTSTGLSEMVPALAPPLGSTMRMLLAMGGGVSTLALAAIFLGGNGKHVANVTPAAARQFRDERSAPETAHLTPNARPSFDDENGNANQTANQREYGETPMARHANVRQSVRDYDLDDTQDVAGESGGFFSRMKQSLSKLPLPRRFDEGQGDNGAIRDFSDLRRLRPGGDDRRDFSSASPLARADAPVRPIAAHAELGEPLPPLHLEPQAAAPLGHGEYGDDLAELDRSARAAADRFAAAQPQAVAAPAPALQPQPVGDTADTAAMAATPTVEALQTTSVQEATPTVAPVSYDAAGIEALVARLELALANVRPIPASVQGATPELDLSAYSDANRIEEERVAEEARLAEERAAEEARQLAEAEAKRRADALAAQDAARRAAEEADRAAEEARRRADEAKALLASLGVEQATPDVVVTPASPPQPTPLRSVEQAPSAAVEPEMDDALRSALRTLRRMSNP